MKAESLHIIRKDLKEQNREELMEICLKLARFKKENKELLTYILFESAHEPGYIESIKQDIDLEFAAINTRNFYYFKKGVRKILRTVKKYIRYSKNKETEITLLIYFCKKLGATKQFLKSTVLQRLYEREYLAIEKKIDKLHGDLQLDYSNMLGDLKKD